MTLHLAQEWETYCKDEIAYLVPFLSQYGYTLEAAQPHIKGERFLMQAVTTTSGRKLILIGQNAEGKRVIIKASRDADGINEINHERLCRQVLSRIDFARDIFHTPKELWHAKHGGYVITIQELIEQEKAFLERPFSEQFMYALSAFKGQEGAHATTYNHLRLIRGVFGVRMADTYISCFNSFKENTKRALPSDDSLSELLSRAYETLTAKHTIIEQYSRFLTHTDFVPHNFRIKDSTMFLLDHSSLTFGNKYEGWARFINFMTLYNPTLEHALVSYVRDNRTQEESVSLRMMRIYRLGEILWYYAQTLEKCQGDLHTLNTGRVHFWKTVLASVLDDREVSLQTIETYKQKRDMLRSSEEKERQVGLH